jgi:hypothetical protein
LRLHQSNARRATRIPGRAQESVSKVNRNTAGGVPTAAQTNYENFRPRASFPVIGAGANGEAAGTLFFLFLSAFGFFFSRLLLNCPFAISSSLLCWGEK